VACGLLSAEIRASASAIENHQGAASEPIITTLRPEAAKGRGYQLVYTVDAPLEATWNFKTDFGSQVLLTNRMITSHRLVSREGNEVITETVYYNKPKLVFRWKTILFPDRHLLEFVLLNPEECDEEYHHGSIQLEAVDAGTRVTQVAYFNFFGASLWVNYPFSGGMSYMLKYTARWEQKAIPGYWHAEK